MAPEQVRGQAVDARADLFAFGAMLYEMVSGRRAFQRRHGGRHDDGDPDARIRRSSRAPRRDLRRRSIASSGTASRRTRTSASSRARDVAFALEALSGSATIHPSGRRRLASPRARAVGRCRRSSQRSRSPRSPPGWRSNAAVSPRFPELSSRPRPGTRRPSPTRASVPTARRCSSAPRRRAPFRRSTRFLPAPCRRSSSAGRARSCWRCRRRGSSRCSPAPGSCITASTTARCRG